MYTKYETSLISVFRIWQIMEFGFIVSIVGSTTFVGPSRFFDHVGGQVLRIDIYLLYS